MILKRVMINISIFMPDPWNGEFSGTPCAGYTEAGRQCGRSVDKARKEVSAGSDGGRCSGFPQGWC